MSRRYTQQEFDDFEIIDGIKQCPNGDYSDIKIFGKGCSFGEECSFGEGCKHMSFVFISVFCLYGLFKYPIIIYKNKDSFVISVGCHNFDSLEKAVAKAKELDCYCEKTHKILELILKKEST